MFSANTCEFEPARCPECGDPAVGLVDCVVSPIGYEQDALFTRSDETELDTQTPLQDERGRYALTCELVGGHQWFARAIDPPRALVRTSSRSSRQTYALRDDEVTIETPHGDTILIQILDLQRLSIEVRDAETGALRHSIGLYTARSKEKTT